VILVAVAVAGSVVAAGWLAGTSSGSSQWVPPGAVAAALHQAGVTVRFAEPVSPSWASSERLFQGRGFRAVWFFLGGAPGLRLDLTRLESPLKPGSGASGQSVGVVEATSDASAARYVANVRPRVGKGCGHALYCAIPEVCSYRNLVVWVFGRNRAASAATLRRVTGALETTAPRPTTARLGAEACAVPLHF
jgi:hypothetical protein